MRNVNVDNRVEGVDNIELSYNHDVRDLDYLIGQPIRNSSYMIIGHVVSIDYYRDGYSHDYAFVVLDNGKRINARKLGLRK